MISTQIMSHDTGFINPQGYKVNLNSTRSGHYTNHQVQKMDDDVSSSFKDVFNTAIGKVNHLQVESDQLRQMMIYEPESVDIHTVQIAAQKAEIALMFAKTVRDQAIKAYTELNNLR